MAFHAARRDLASPRECDLLNKLVDRPPLKSPDVKAAIATFRINTDDPCFSTEQCSRMEKPRGRWTFCNETGG